METLNLKELIHTVRQELIDSENERIEKGLSPLFKVDSLKIEVNFVVEKVNKTGGKIDIKIVDVGHDITYSSQQIHKILLELKTCDDSENDTQTPFEEEKRIKDLRPGIISVGRRPGVRPGIISGVKPIELNNKIQPEVKPKKPRLGIFQEDKKPKITSKTRTMKKRGK